MHYKSKCLWLFQASLTVIPNQNLTLSGIGIFVKLTCSWVNCSHLGSDTFCVVNAEEAEDLGVKQKRKTGRFFRNAAIL